jgi:hypothetical protein
MSLPQSVPEVHHPLATPQAPSKEILQAKRE